ncbi:MAG: DUF4271 domain-containing protein [Marinifilaceae bacterium]
MSVQNKVKEIDTLSIQQVDFILQDSDSIRLNYSSLSVSDSGNYFVGIPLDKNEDIVGCAIFTFLFMALFALLRFHSKDLLNKMINTILQRKNVEVLLSDGIVSNSYYYFIALILSFSMPAIALCYILYDELKPITALMYLGAFLSYHLLLLFSITICGWCFNKKSAATEVTANLWAINISSGIIVAPLVIAMLFMKTFAIQFILQIVNFCFLAYILFIFIRIASILFSHRVSIFYIILYLCALEIVPLMILYKVIME